MNPAIKRAWRGGRDGRPGWWLDTTFSQDFIDAVKTLPVRDRAWDEAQSAWWVALDQQDELLRILPNFQAYLAQGQLL